MKINLKRKENIIVLCIIVAVIIFASSIPIKTDATKQSKVYKAYLGDVNLDGKVTSEDSRLILRMSVGLEKEKTLADINQDGKITSEDSRLALRMSVGEEKLKQVDTYIDRFGNASILYKQNDATNKNQEYRGRYKEGKYINKKETKLLKPNSIIFSIYKNKFTFKKNINEKLY